MNSHAVVCKKKNDMMREKNKSVHQNQFDKKKITREAILFIQTLKLSLVQYE